MTTYRKSLIYLSNHAFWYSLALLMGLFQKIRILPSPFFWVRIAVLNTFHTHQFPESFPTDSCFEAPRKGAESHTWFTKNCIFGKTWNKTYVLKKNSKIRTDEITDQIEMKAGAPKTHQRITHQSQQLTTRETLQHYNIQQNDTIDSSLELHSGTEATGTTEQPAMDT